MWWQIRFEVYYTYLKPWLQALTEVVMVAILSHHHQNKEVIPMSVVSGYPLFEV